MLTVLFMGAADLFPNLPLLGRALGPRAGLPRTGPSVSGLPTGHWASPMLLRSAWTTWGTFLGRPEAPFWWYWWCGPCPRRPLRLLLDFLPTGPGSRARAGPPPGPRAGPGRTAPGLVIVGGGPDDGSAGGCWGTWCSRPVMRSPWRHSFLNSWVSAPGSGREWGS